MVIQNTRVTMDSVYLGDTRELQQRAYLGFDASYEVTRDGKVIRKSDGRKYVGSKTLRGYLSVRLPVSCSTHKDGRYSFRVHRLVARAYLPDYSEDLQVNHKNGIKTDNRVENLEMCTNAKNVYHAWNTLDSKKKRALAAQRCKEKTRPIAQYTYKGDLVKIWTAHEDFDKAFGKDSYSNIWLAIAKGRLRYKHLWYWADDALPTKEEVQYRYVNSYSQGWYFRYQGEIYNLKELALLLHRDRHSLIAEIKNKGYKGVEILHYSEQIRNGNKKR